MLSGVLASLFSLPGVAIAQVNDAPSLAGVIDIHARGAGTGALNFKRHRRYRSSPDRAFTACGDWCSKSDGTASWAYLVSQMVGHQALRGIVLNRAVGGINPRR